MDFNTIYDIDYGAKNFVTDSVKTNNEALKDLSSW